MLRIIVQDLTTTLNTNNMKTQYAEDLAKAYEFTTAEDYFQYIIDSVINGQRSQAKKLFLAMDGYDKERFLIDYCKTQGDTGESTKNICIGALLNY